MNMWHAGDQLVFAHRKAPSSYQLTWCGWEDLPVMWRRQREAAAETALWLSWLERITRHWCRLHACNDLLPLPYEKHKTSPIAQQTLLSRRMMLEQGMLVHGRTERWFYIGFSHCLTAAATRGRTENVLQANGALQNHHLQALEEPKL